MNAAHDHAELACRRFMEDGTNDPVIELLAAQADQISAWSADVVGFSVMMARQLYCALVMARLIKQRQPSVRIIVGGALVSAELAGYLERVIEIDAAVAGEGEQALAGF